MTNLTPIQNIETPKILEFIQLNFEKIYNGMDIVDLSKPVYISNGRDFVTFLETNIFDIDVFRTYKDFLRSRTDIKAGTKNAKLTAAKLLLQSLHSRYRLLPMDLTEGVKSFKVQSGHKKDGMNQKEIDLIRNYVLYENDHYRLVSMFALLAFQGLRQFEVCNLQIEDVNFQDSTAMIRGKGFEDKAQIDLHPYTCNFLIHYIENCKIKSGYFFTSEKGTTIGEKLTERGFRKIWDAIFKELKINRTVHGFRHYFVTTMLEETNGNIGIVKKFSRHQSTEALTMYDDRKNKKSLLPTFYNAFGKFESQKPIVMNDNGLLIQEVDGLQQVVMPL
jgi:integrase